MHTYEREVSWTDRACVARDEIRAPDTIQLVLEGLGSLPPETLRDALRRTTDVNPGSSLVLDETGLVLKWRIGPPPSLTIVDAPEFEASSESDAPFLLSPLDARTGPSCGLLLVRGRKNDYLIFRALHAVMDGRGTLSWARDFMRCLRGEVPVGHSSTVTVDHLLREAGARRRPYPLPDALHPFGPADPDTRSGGFRWRRITANRPLDALVSGRIAVALAHRARTRGEEGTFRLNLPADLRHYRPNDRTTGNLFSCLHVEVPPEAAADDVSLRIVQQLYTHEPAKQVGLYTSDFAGSLAVFRVKMFLDLSHQDDTGRYLFSATLSNLGIIQSAELSSPGFRATSAFFVPSDGDSGCVVSLNGFDERTEAAAGLSDRFAGGGKLDEFVDLVRAAIEVSGKKRPDVDRRR